MKEQIFAVWMAELTEFVESLDPARQQVALHRIIVGLAAECPDEKAYKILKFVEAEVQPSPIILPTQ